MPERPHAFAPASDTRAAEWLLAGVRDFDHTVGSVVPSSLPAYARVFHPAGRHHDDGTGEVRWAEVAAANGRVMHPAAEWGSITGSWKYQLGGAQPGVWEVPPSTGDLPSHVAQQLAAVLARHTTTPRQCWFGVWVGRGADLADHLSGAPTFELPSREMWLLHGEVDAAAASPYLGPFFEDSVNVWWPDDEAWCVGTDIDLMTTYVGASRACVVDLLADDSLEALGVSVDQRVTWDADNVNRLPPPPGPRLGYWRLGRESEFQRVQRPVCHSAHAAGVPRARAEMALPSRYQVSSDRRDRRCRVAATGQPWLPRGPIRPPARAGPRPRRPSGRTRERDCARSPWRHRAPGPPYARAHQARQRRWAARLGRG